MAFATASDLAAYLQTDVDTATANLLLDLATGAIQSATGQTIERVEDDEVTLRPSPGKPLVLPQRPADDPTVVEVDGDVVTDFTVITDGLGRTALHRLEGWVSYDLVTNAPQRVSVTYSHGYDAIPAEIKRVCLQVAGRGYRNPEGLRSETVGSESYTYATETIAGVDLTDAEVQACRHVLGLPVVGVVSLYR